MRSARYLKRYSLHQPASQQLQPRTSKLFVYITSSGRSRARYTAATKTAGPYFSTTDPADKVSIKRALEIAERASNSWELHFTDFLTPPVASDVLVNVSKLATVAAQAWGGHERAERCRICFGKEELMLAAQQNMGDDSGVAAVSVRGRFVFDAATHRDFLGACLGTGIERSRVGDIVVTGDEGAQILVVPELVPHLEATLVQVRSVSVETRRLPLSELLVPEPRQEVIQTVESSLRVDSVASAGFKLSRGKMTDFVKRGDVRVNWKPAKASTAVASGDVISCAGKGRVEIGEISMTKKGRYAIELVRLI